MTDEETARSLAGPHDDHCLREPCRCLREHRRVEILIAIKEARATADATLANLAAWTLAHGATLCPTAGSADTFGDGMREAKRQVGEIIREPR